jgi:hypothetical protein
VAVLLRAVQVATDKLKYSLRLSATVAQVEAQEVLLLLSVVQVVTEASLEEAEVAAEAVSLGA